MFIILAIFFSLYEVKIVFKSDQHVLDVKYRSNHRKYKTQSYNQDPVFKFVYLHKLFCFSPC